MISPSTGSSRPFTIASSAFVALLSISSAFVALQLISSVFVALQLISSVFVALQLISSVFHFQLHEERGILPAGHEKHDMWGKGLFIHTKPWVRARYV